jgi:hypothetical protein
MPISKVQDHAASAFEKEPAERIGAEALRDKALPHKGGE